MKSASFQQIDRERLLTSHEASALLQVNPSTINKWVEQGRLQAFRTPGGHRRIRARDLVDFLDQYEMPIPKSFGFAQKKRLLFIDDDEKQLQGLKRLFKPWSDQVELLLTTSGIEALLQVGTFKPHLIVLDVFMPDVDGLEVCRRLKAHPDTARIDLIIASGRLTNSIEQRALQAGAVRCLRKPIEIEVLLEQLGITARERFRT